MLINPARFFAGLGDPGAGNVKTPLIFAVVCGVISAPLSFFAAPLDPLAPEGPDPLSRFASLMQNNDTVAVALAIAFVVLLPLFAILGVYIGAAIQHLFVLLFARERRGFQATFNVIAYGGSAISLLSWLPVAGYIAGLYGVYVAGVGLRELHGTTTVRALLAAGIPALIGLGPALFGLLSSSSGV